MNNKINKPGNTIALLVIGFIFSSTLLLFIPKYEKSSSYISKDERSNVYNSTNPMYDPQSPIAFERCAKVRVHCVVDGDTFWYNGTKIRIADIDTPEIGQPKCAGEYNLGIKATYRLIDLLNQGPFDLQEYQDKSADNYGRRLLVVIRDGKSVGMQLVNEGLARPWDGSRQPWC
jgi:endonuclease YncB( thermonuclease family)